MNNRKTSLDVIRTLAIALVILNHVVEKTYTYTVAGMQDIGSSSQLLAMSLFTLARQGVPLFLFLTGYLLLPRSYEGKVLHFWESHLLPLIITWEVWIVIYTFFLYLYIGIPFTLLDLIKKMLFLKGVGLSHEWYMPMIIGMYFFIPLLSIVLNKIDTKIIIICALITYFYYFVLPSLNIILTIQGKELCYGLLDMHYSGGEYGLYLVLGYLSSKIKFSERKRSFLYIGIFIGAYLCTVQFQKYVFNNSYEYGIWYAFLLVPVSSFALFMFLKDINIRQDFINKLFYNISKVSFGMYLMHMIPLHMIGDFLLSLNLHHLIMIMLLWGSVTICCLLAAFIINHFRRLRMLLLYIKA